MISLNDFLTDAEIQKARQLYETYPPNFAKKCAVEIIQPVLGRINKKFRQQNEAMYLAYVVEFVMMQNCRQ